MSTRKDQAYTKTMVIKNLLELPTTYAELEAILMKADPVDDDKKEAIKIMKGFGWKQKEAEFILWHLFPTCPLFPGAGKRTW